MNRKSPSIITRRDFIRRAACAARRPTLLIAPATPPWLQTGLNGRDNSLKLAKPAFGIVVAGAFMLFPMYRRLIRIKSDNQCVCIGTIMQVAQHQFDRSENPSPSATRRLRKANDFHVGLE